jgi:AcrR family transcriptional regulator
MARWQPDARGRLQEAAVTLFLERGYDEVTVADIAERAGLTKRSFFNHFADKREVLFAGAQEFVASVLAQLAQAPGDLDPLDAALWAYTQAAAPLEDYVEIARARRRLIDSSSELQERDLIKMASTTAKVADALVVRGVTRRDAIFVSQAATTVFTTAFDDWTHDPRPGLAGTIQSARRDLKAALASQNGETGPFESSSAARAG